MRVSITPTAKRGRKPKRAAGPQTRKATGPTKRKVIERAPNMATPTSLIAKMPLPLASPQTPALFKPRMKTAGKA